MSSPAPVSRFPQRANKGVHAVLFNPDCPARQSQLEYNGAPPSPILDSSPDDDDDPAADQPKRGNRSLVGSDLDSSSDDDDDSTVVPPKTKTKIRAAGSTKRAIKRVAVAAMEDARRAYLTKPAAKPAATPSPAASTGAPLSRSSSTSSRHSATGTGRLGPSRLALRQDAHATFASGSLEGELESVSDDELAKRLDLSPATVRRGRPRLPLSDCDKSDGHVSDGDLPDGDGGVLDVQSLPDRSDSESSDGDLSVPSTYPETQIHRVQAQQVQEARRFSYPRTHRRRAQNFPASHHCGEEGPDHCRRQAPAATG